MQRKVNLLFDKNPSDHHFFNYKIAKPFISNKKVLDIGCWTGLLENLAIKNAKKITGIDISAEAIEYATKKHPKGNFKVASALKLPFAKKSFDTVLMLEVIEHLPKESEPKVFSEIRRVLKPGGYLVLSTPSNHPVSILMDPAYFLIGHRHYSINQLSKIAADLDFSVVKTFRTGGLFFLTKANLETLAKHFFGRKPQFPEWFTRRVGNEYKKRGFATIHLIFQLK